MASDLEVLYERIYATTDPPLSEGSQAVLYKHQTSEFAEQSCQEASWRSQSHGGGSGAQGQLAHVSSPFLSSEEEEAGRLDRAHHSQVPEWRLVCAGADHAFELDVFY